MPSERRAGAIVVLCFGLILLPSCGGGSNPPPPQNPVPAIQSLSPPTIAAGTSGFTLTINGSNFLSTSRLTWNGVQRMFTLVSSSQLATAISAADLAATGTVQITVANPAPGGGQASMAFTISPPAAPVVGSISPTTVNVGGPAFTLAVMGSNFVQDSVVQLNGVGQSTTYVDNSHLTASIPVSAINGTAVGNLPITVATPPPGGGSSNSAPILVEYPLPSLTSLSPSTAVLGNGSFTLTVNGGNFATGATVFWNNVSRVTQFVSSTQLTASILVSDLTVAAGTVGVTVANPSPSAGISNIASFTVENPAPIVSSITPTSSLAGDPQFVNVTGSGFVTGATVQLGGRSFPTNFTSSTSIFAGVDSLPVGSLTLTVTNPPPTVGPSNGVPFSSTPAGPGAQIFVASIDPGGSTVSAAGVFSSTGRFFAFDRDLRDTCLGAPSGCVPNTILYTGVGAVGVSTDGRYASSTIQLNCLPLQCNGQLEFSDTCEGVSPGCTQTTTTLPGTGPDITFALMSATGRYITNASQPMPGFPVPFSANIYDTCVGAAPGCTQTQIPVTSQDFAGVPVPSADGRYLVYNTQINSIDQVVLHDTCLGAPPGCAISETVISPSSRPCASPQISSDANYVIYQCYGPALQDDLYLQATCINALPSCSTTPIAAASDLSGRISISSSFVSMAGRFVAFAASGATINGQSLYALIFVYDSCNGAAPGCTQRTVPVSLNASGAVANNDCYLTGLSADGQYILFYSAATNLGGTLSGQSSGTISYIVRNPLF
jgi:hypothetical protein